jgi:hypothetical protein
MMGIDSPELTFEHSGPNMNLLVRLQVPTSGEGPLTSLWVRIFDEDDILQLLSHQFGAVHKNGLFPK